MTPRQHFIAALERRPLPGRVPHFELVFFLTMELMGKVHPRNRLYDQWLQMSSRERDLHRRDMAQVFIDTAAHYGHDAIFVHCPLPELEERLRLVETIRELSGDKYFLMMHGDATFSVPTGSDMEQMSLRMAEQPEDVEAQAADCVRAALDEAELIARHGMLDGFALCSDYCFNTGPFLPLSWFDRFVTPYLRQLVAGYRDLGFYVIKHTDGNIMPILDRLVDAQPHAIHSLDPQGGVDIAKVVDKVADRVAICGNVNCGLLQSGTDEQCVESARYALTHGMRAPGYIFSTSNCIYTGMPLERYDLIIDVWRKHGVRL